MVPPFSGPWQSGHSTEHGRARRDPPAAFVSSLRLLSSLWDLSLRIRCRRRVFLPSRCAWCFDERRLEESLPFHHTIRLPLLSAGFRESRRRFPQEGKRLFTSSRRLRETEHFFTVWEIYCFRFPNNEKLRTNTLRLSSRRLIRSRRISVQPSKTISGNKKILRPVKSGGFPKLEASAALGERRREAFSTSSD